MAIAIAPTDFDRRRADARMQTRLRAEFRTVAPRPEPEIEAMVSPRSRYAPRSHRTVLLFVIAAHILAIGMMLTARVAMERKLPVRSLSTFDVMPAAIHDIVPPAEPVEAAVETPSMAPRPATVLPVAPAPMVETPRVPSPVTVAPAPVAGVPVAAPVAAAPAPPAPITPPDFRASQLDNPGPAYPFLSRRAKEEGVVTLRVLVNEAGRAAEVRVDRSSGHGRLDDAALATVKKWKFVPARQAGKPVQAWVLVPVTFSLG